VGQYVFALFYISNFNKATAVRVRIRLRALNTERVTGER
jgi:hypothetical protein